MNFYPFGLAIARDNPVQNDNARNTTNRYLYNEKELQAGTGYLDYGARMYMPEVGRWGVVDRFSEKYYDFSPFSYGANNPLRFVDINGDSVIVSQSIASNKAFITFANTKQGSRFLANYAAKGQTIAGKTYSKDGKYHSKGMNLTYEAENINNPETAGLLRSNETANGVNFTVILDTDPNRSTFDQVTTLFHESFIHVDLGTKDYLDDNKLNKSNLSLTSSQKVRAYSVNHYQHIKVADDFLKYKYQSSHLWPAAAMEGLQEANKMLNLKHTDTYLLKTMWNYSGGIKFE